jgi:phosphoribosylformylglycinamidine cyclo-ligase
MTAYEQAGVDYDVLDAGKRRALAAALSTSHLAGRRGASVLDASRGEPAVLVDLGEVLVASVLECLGTKSTIAREYEVATGVDRYDAIGYDTVAAALNDLACVGASPVLVNAYFATGSAGWYSGTRHASLVAGWVAACEEAGAAWGGGESPTLAGIVAADEIDLAASAFGVVPRRAGAPWLGEALAAGDEIVLVASSGLHANGASLARKLARELPRGLEQPLPGGRAFGDALLDRTVLYCGLVDRVRDAGLPVRYVSHITGHGLRKLMRAERELTYRVERLPSVPEVLSFLVAHSGLDEREAYGTLNMGAGLAIYCAAGAGGEVVAAAAELGIEALVAGSVEEGPRRVLLEPVGVEFASTELQVR